MSELEAKFRISLQGKEELSQFFRQSEQSSKSFASNIDKQMKMVASSITGLGRSMQSILGTIAPGLTAGLGQSMKGVIDFNEQINRIGVSANLSTSQMSSLSKSILKVSLATGQFKEDAAAAMAEFVDKTGGKLEEGIKQLELYGKVAMATGTNMQRVASIGADLERMGIDDQGTAMGILAAQGKGGPLKMRQMINSERMVTTFMSGNLEGEQGLREGGAIMQMIARATGGKGKGGLRALNSLESIFKTINELSPAIAEAGIKTEDDNTDSGKRSSFEIFKDIIRKYKGDANTLRHVFGASAYRGMAGTAAEYRKTGRFDELDKSVAVSGDLSTIDDDAAKASTSDAMKFKQAVIRRQNFLQGPLTEVADFAADHADGLNAVSTGMSWLQSGMGLLSKIGMGQGSRSGADALAAMGVQSVFVVNMPTVGLGGGGTPGPTDVVVGGWFAKTLWPAVKGVTKEIGAEVVSVVTPMVAGAAAGVTTLLYSPALNSHEFTGSYGPLERDIAEKREAYEKDQRNKIVISSLSVNIDGDRASIEADGVRSPSVMATRTTCGDP